MKDPGRALGAPADIAADKTLRQFICLEVQRVLGNVLNRELNLSVFFDGIHINPCSRHGIFADIYVQVLKHAPDAAAVRTDQKRFRLENTDQVEIAAFEPLRKFSGSPAVPVHSGSGS